MVVVAEPGQRFSKPEYNDICPINDGNNGTIDDFLIDAGGEVESYEDSNSKNRRYSAIADHTYATETDKGFSEELVKLCRGRNGETMEANRIRAGDDAETKRKKKKEARKMRNKFTNDK